MSTTAPPRLEFPALLGAVPANAAKRVWRGVLGAALVIVLAAAITVGVAAWLGHLGDAGWLIGAAMLAGLGVGLLISFWGGFSGRWLPDLLVGTRSVGTEDGRSPGALGWVRAVLVGALGVVSLGIVPLVLCLRTKDENGRVWQDRLTGVATIDLRGGRDVLVHPVTATELDAYYRVPVVRPAIIQVDPEQARQAWSPTTGGGAVPASRGYQDAPTRTAAAMAPAQPTRASGVAWLLRFDNGQTHLLRDAAVIGRSPAAPASYRGADLVRLDDPTQTVSATHLAVRGTEVGVWVEDLGSTNGSEILGPDGRGRAIAARSPQVVARGARIRVGDRWFSIEAAPA